jgi:hypothetical protein
MAFGEHIAVDHQQTIVMHRVFDGYEKSDKEVMLPAVASDSSGYNDGRLELP